MVRFCNAQKGFAGFRVIRDNIPCSSVGYQEDYAITYPKLYFNF